MLQITVCSRFINTERAMLFFKCVQEPRVLSQWYIRTRPPSAVEHPHGSRNSPEVPLFYNNNNNNDNNK